MRGRPRKYLTIEEFDDYRREFKEMVNNRLRHMDTKIWVIMALLGIILFVIGMTS